MLPQVRPRRNAGRPSSDAEVSHDPLICGIDAEGDCPACRAAAARAEAELLERDATARRRDARRELAQRFRAMLGADLPLLKDFLLDLLAEEIADIALAAVEERRA